MWSSALKDIMTTVTFPDHSPRSFSLSSLELKHRAVLAARVERYWGQPKVLVTSRNLQSLPTRDGVIKARLVKGGQWIVLLLTDGTLCLQAAAANAPCAVDTSFRTLANSYVWMTLSLSAGMPRETLVLLRTSTWDAGYVFSMLSSVKDGADLECCRQPWKSIDYDCDILCRYKHF